MSTFGTKPHQDWLGMVQPTGLFLAPRVLADAGAAPTDPVTDVQETLGTLTVDGTISDIDAFFRDVFGWPDPVFLRGESLPPELTLTLDGGIRVAPDFALRDLDEPAYVLLGMTVDASVELDRATDDPLWTASAHQRFERLLRARECPVGVLTNHRSLRVVYAPRGEATAHATWNVRDLTTVAGRPLLAALHMCLNARRLLTLDGAQRLPSLLARSREFQNTVSTQLQGQVLDALQELLDGLQRADRVTDGRLLGPWRQSDADRQGIYHGLVTALLRVVFVLFAEERRLLPLDAPRYREGYALTELHTRLVADHARLGARLDARYGAWARVVALFRLLHDGIDARGVPGGFALPARRGEFFDPDRFAFLEGRAPSPRPPRGVPLELPKVSDGTVLRVLDRLLVLDGERLKYSDLAVEQIGSVYEGIMGYTLEVAEGRALRVRLAGRESGALDVVIDLARFESGTRDEFVKHLEDDLGLKLSDATARALKKSTTEADVAAALAQQRTFRNTTAIERGWMYLQPGEERRRSGSHYTPRSLTAPIVERTLAPVLARLGEHPTPDALLALRVCDPAMGSGAFLVEACRQLAARLEAAWTWHDVRPSIPPDEDPQLHARRLVAQHCLYGVDRNPLAVDLARLSLWLETFARDHAFTFLDHCLRHGDSLVGLSLDQIASVALDTRKGAQLDLVRKTVTETLAAARSLRREIHRTGDGDPPDNEGQRALWRDTQGVLLEARTVGDLVVAAFFTQKSDKDRKTWLAGWHPAVMDWLGGQNSGKALRDEVKRALEAKGLVPFHWPLEFPEVFEGDNPGFDAFVGNPPFLGGTRISTNYGSEFLDWLTTTFEDTGNRTDLVAYFFRRAFNYLRDGGTMGFIATNTIAQGDTREGGLRWIRQNGGIIYDARRRYPWPGLAAVIVSVIHISKRLFRDVSLLDGNVVDTITAFLFSNGPDRSPQPLNENANTSFEGFKLGGQGFLFADGDDACTPLHIRDQLIAKDARNAAVIFPYVGGEDINSDPQHESSRYVINFGAVPLEQAEKWPDLIEIVREKVKPIRDKANRDSHRLRWWQFAEVRPGLVRATNGLSRVLVIARVTQHSIFAWLPKGIVFSEGLVVFPVDRDSFFAVMQSRIHEAWARFFASSLGDGLRYTPTDCFETFPFPAGWETNAALDDIGRRYHEHRAAMMKRTVGTKKPEGLTATYNRFHDVNDRTPAVVELRALHAAMDRAVLDAYGWQDLRPVYDYRVQLDERVRYTWDDDTRDEVLARLLELNRQRASTATPEADAPDAATKPAASPATAKKPRKKKGDAPPTLPGVG